MDKLTQSELRMQMLAGVITEGQYKAKLQENEMAAVGEKVEATVEDKLEATVDKLTDEQKSQLRAELAKAGITADSKIEDVAGKLDESLNEVEGDTKTKVANALSDVGGGLMKSLLVPIIPVAIGSLGPGVAAGFAITAGVAGGLIALAKLLGAEKTQESLNEHYVAGGIVGIGAINQIPSRAKTDYEDAFEYFLSQKYSINEVMDDEMVDSKTLADYIAKLIELADDMEYTPEMVDELENLKNTLSDGSMSKEDALNIAQKTIDITGDDIDAAEALNQAISGDYELDEGKEVEEPYNY